MALAEVGAGDFIAAETLNYIIQRAVNRPTCKLALAAVQSMAYNANTPVNFAVGTEIFDDLNWHSTSVNTSRITPTYPGRYLVTGQISWVAAAGGDRRVMILKNGGFTNMWNTANASGSEITTSVTDEIELNGTTDYLTLAGFQNQTSAAALNCNGAGDSIRTTSLTVTYLGESL